MAFISKGEDRARKEDENQTTNECQHGPDLGQHKGVIEEQQFGINRKTEHAIY